MIIFKSTEFSKGHPSPTDKTAFVATFAEVKSEMERLIAKTKKDYRASLLSGEPLVVFPFLEAKITFYVAQPDKSSSSYSSLDKTPTTLIVLTWSRYGNPDYAHCKERLKIKTANTNTSRYRDNKPDLFWGIVEDYFKTGNL